MVRRARCKPSTLPWPRPLRRRCSSSEGSKSFRCLIRRWGRIGAGGQRLVHHFKCEEEAVGLFLQLLRQKRLRGYRPKSLSDTIVRRIEWKKNCEAKL
nr:WGR domain-containing protein [Rhizobium sp. P28RR-XV]